MALFQRHAWRSTLGGLAAAGVACFAPGAVAQIADQDMQRALHQRDAVIEQLQRRIEALERRVRSGEPRSARSVAVVPAPVTAEPLRQVAPQAARDLSPPRPMAPGTITQASPAPPPRPEPATPGTEEDEFVARALERTLVEQGAQVLPPYAVQIAPFAGYTFQGDTQLSFVASNQLVPGTIGQQLVTQRTRRESAEGGVIVRLGLPWESQLNIRLPFGWSRGEATFASTAGATRTASGIGDISINLQKQVFHERGWLPDVLLNAFYVADTGRSPLSQQQVSTFGFNAGTGSGFDAVGGGLTLLKRQDPLVFLGSINYAHTFSNTFDGLKQQPGDAYTVRLSPILAASPDTSLRLAWETTFQQRREINGQSLRGSDQVVSFLELGVGSVISRNLFVDASVAIGLTRDSPDFRALILFPYRF